MGKTKLALNVVNDLRSLAESIEALVNVIEPEAKETKNKATVKKTKVTKETTEEKQPTLEELRSLMAEKNRDGHREKIKAIIVNHGANKLTELEPECYLKVLKEVEAIK